MEVEKQIRDLERRIDHVASGRGRTFRDGPQAGLSNPEIRQLLGELAEEHAELTWEVKTLKGRLGLLQNKLDWATQARRIAVIASAKLETATPDDQVALIELLDIRAKALDDGYEISGSIPLETPDSRGEIDRRLLGSPPPAQPGGDPQPPRHRRPQDTPAPIPEATPGW